MTVPRDDELIGILRARGGSSDSQVCALHAVKYSPRTRR